MTLLDAAKALANHIDQHRDGSLSIGISSRCRDGALQNFLAALAEAEKQEPYAWAVEYDCGEDSDESNSELLWTETEAREVLDEYRGGGKKRLFPLYRSPPGAPVQICPECEPEGPPGRAGELAALAELGLYLLSEIQESEWGWEWTDDASKFAERHGLMERRPYDPERDGESAYLDPGTEGWFLTERCRELLDAHRARGKETR